MDIRLTEALKLKVRVTKVLFKEPKWASKMKFSFPSYMSDDPDHSATLYSAFCLLKLQNSNTKAAVTIFVKKVQHLHGFTNY